jgi:hypothetical protein
VLSERFQLRLTPEQRRLLDAEAIRREGRGTFLPPDELDRVVEEEHEALPGLARR